MFSYCRLCGGVWFDRCGLCGQALPQYKPVAPLSTWRKPYRGKGWQQGDPEPEKIVIRAVFRRRLKT